MDIRGLTLGFILAMGVPLCAVQTKVEFKVDGKSSVQPIVGQHPLRLAKDNFMEIRRDHQVVDRVFASFLVDVSGNKDLVPTPKALASFYRECIKGNDTHLRTDIGWNPGGDYFVYAINALGEESQFFTYDRWRRRNVFLCQWDNYRPEAVSFSPGGGAFVVFNTWVGRRAPCDWFLLAGSGATGKGAPLSFGPHGDPYDGDTTYGRLRHFAWTGPDQFTFDLELKTRSKIRGEERSTSSLQRYEVATDGPKAFRAIPVARQALP